LRRYEIAIETGAVARLRQPASGLLISK